MYIYFPIAYLYPKLYYCIDLHLLKLLDFIDFTNFHLHSYSMSWFYVLLFLLFPISIYIFLISPSFQLLKPNMVHLHLKVFFIHSLKICSIRAFPLPAPRTCNLLFLELLEKTLPGLMQGVGLLQVFCRCWLDSSCVCATPLPPWLCVSKSCLSGSCFKVCSFHMSWDCC